MVQRGGVINRGNACEMLIRIGQRIDHKTTQCGCLSWPGTVHL